MFPAKTSVKFKEESIIFLMWIFLRGAVEAYGYCITGVFHYNELNSVGSAEIGRRPGEGSCSLMSVCCGWRVALEVLLKHISTQCGTRKRSERPWRRD